MLQPGKKSIFGAVLLFLGVILLNILLRHLAVKHGMKVREKLSHRLFPGGKASVSPRQAR
jgi:hypothetical protein